MGAERVDEIIESTYDLLKSEMTRGMPSTRRVSFRNRGSNNAKYSSEFAGRPPFRRLIDSYTFPSKSLLYAASSSSGLNVRATSKASENESAITPSKSKRTKFLWGIMRETPLWFFRRTPLHQLLP